MGNTPHQSDSRTRGRWQALSLWLAACAPAVQVHGSGAAQQERAAVQEEQTAAEHEKQYRSYAINAVCSSRGERPAGVVCWASASNPTEQHLREAERNRALAAAHRAALSPLRGAEASACAGVGMAYCPLDVRGVTAHVSSEHGGCAVVRGGRYARTSRKASTRFASELTASCVACAERSMD